MGTGLLVSKGSADVFSQGKELLVKHPADCGKTEKLTIGKKENVSTLHCIKRVFSLVERFSMVWMGG